MFRVLLGCFFLFLIELPQTLASKRVALVVGNNEYESSQNLENPVNDANLITRSLRKVGFDVITIANGTRRDMLDAVAQFGRQSTDADISLFFYAGHGLEVAGRNWILPTNANIEVSSDLPSAAVKVGDVLETMELSGARVRIVILDACRNNPLSRSLTRSTGRGLAKIDASAAGTMIVFSAAPGEVALDGTGQNSPFSIALASNIVEEGLEVRQMLGRVRQDVMAATGEKQVPWVNEAIVGDFYLTKPKTKNETKTSTSTTPAVQVPNSGLSADLSVELAFWDAVKNSRETAIIELYLEKYPDGKFVDIARALIASIENNPASQQSTQRDRELQQQQQQQQQQAQQQQQQASLNRMESQARAFVQDVNGLFSGPADRAISEIGRYYNRSVTYYGRTFSIPEIVRDKRSLMKRWPQRQYRAPDNLVKVRCNQSRQSCNVESDVYWNVYSPSRNKSANGVQRTYFELDFSTGTPRISYENGENITNR